jgi:bifunctional DNase/RNase
MQPSRPLTHDLMKNFMNAFSVELHEVIISDLNDGIFYAKLICTDKKETLEIDSRTSDALALAVRFGCPIYTYESILEQAGISMEEPEGGREKKGAKETVSESEEDLASLSVEELNQLLKEVLEHEDYIRAISIRDEINRRKKKKK